MIQHRENQREKLRRALEQAPYSANHPGGAGRWLGVDSIMRLGIAQYNSRLHELRRAGFEIENYREWDDAAQAYKSWYRIVGSGLMNKPGKEKVKSPSVEEIKS